MSLFRGFLTYYNMEPIEVLETSLSGFRLRALRIFFGYIGEFFGFIVPLGTEKSPAMDLIGWGSPS
jgi:hypothetical protein